MKPISRVLLAAIVVMLASAVMAAATHDDNTVSALPWYKALEPYLQVLWQTLIALAVPALAALLYRYTGIKLQDSDRSAIQSAAANAAGRIIAGIEGPVSNVKFDLGSSQYAGVIRAEAERIIATLPDELERRNITPEKVATLIQGKLGQLQSGTIAVPHT